MERESLYQAEKLLEELEGFNVPREKVETLKETFAPLFQKEREREQKEKWKIEKCSWEGFVPSTNIRRVIDTLSNVISYHQEAKLEESKYHEATQDLLHAFELTEPSDEELIALGREMQQLRKERRKTKDFIEATEPLFHFAINNRPLIKELGQIQNEINKIMQEQSNRTYRTKEKTALQDAFDKAKEREKVTA